MAKSAKQSVYYRLGPTSKKTIIRKLVQTIGKQVKAVGKHAGKIGFNLEDEYQPAQDLFKKRTTE